MLGSLFIAFVLVPIVELWLLIKVGSLIGVVPTLLIVLGTGALGAHLARREGLKTLRRYQQAVARGELPTTEMLEGLTIFAGGVLLLTPGFLTDLLGFLLLWPMSRRVLQRWLVQRARRTIERAHVVVVTHSTDAPDDTSHGPESEGPVYDAHFD